MQKKLIGLAVLALTACTAPLPPHATAEQIRKKALLYSVGWPGVAEQLETNNELREHVLTRICSGEPDWLEVARKLYPSQNVHLSEELGSAISVALLQRPSDVLGAFGAGACIPPDDLPSACDQTDWLKRAQIAVARVTDDKASEAKAKCVAEIGTEP